MSEKESDMDMDRLQRPPQGDIDAHGSISSETAQRQSGGATQIAATPGIWVSLPFVGAQHQIEDVIY